MHSCTKHTELDLFFVREKVLEKQIQVVHVPAIDQKADILTKALTPPNFATYRSMLRVVENFTSTLSLTCGGYRSIFTSTSLLCFHS